jgi:hypothetical protein
MRLCRESLALISLSIALRIKRTTIRRLFSSFLGCHSSVVHPPSQAMSLFDYTYPGPVICEE